MEEILNDWKKLSLTDVEGKKISLSKSRNWNNKEYVLAARFFTRRALNVGKPLKPFGDHDRSSRYGKLVTTYFYSSSNSKLMLNES